MSFSRISLSFVLAALVAFVAAPPVSAQQVIEGDPIVIRANNPDPDAREVSREIIHQDALVTLEKVTYSDGTVRIEGRATRPDEGGVDLTPPSDDVFGQPGADDQLVRPGDDEPEPLSNETYEPDFDRPVVPDFEC